MSFFALRWPFYLRIRLLQAGLQATPVPLNVDIPYDTPLIELSGGNDNSVTNLQACTGECNTDATARALLSVLNALMVNRFLGARAMVVKRNRTIVMTLI